MVRQLRPEPAVFKIGIAIVFGHRAAGATDWQARPGPHRGLRSLSGSTCLAVGRVASRAALAERFDICLAVGRVASQAVPAGHCCQPPNNVPVLMFGKAVFDNAASYKACTLTNGNRGVTDTEFAMTACIAIVILATICQIIRPEPGAETVCR